MFTLQLMLLAAVGLVGILFNWLLILAIQRKTYHYQESHRMASPLMNMSLLRPNASVSAQVVRPPLLPSVRSSISTFDKYILAFLINDICVCNFILPLRVVDISQGLPSAFLCFLLKFCERLATIVEIIIVNLLIVTSLVFFLKKRLATTKLCFLCLLCLTPLLLISLAPTLTHLDIDESSPDRKRPPSCKQIFIYLNASTQRTLNILCCLITYAVLVLHFVLLVKTKWAIKQYTLTSLRSMTETATLTRHLQQEISLFDQSAVDVNNRRSLFVPSTSIAADTMSASQRSPQTFDHLSYLTIIENSQTLIKSTCMLLVIYAVVHVPYWTYELFYAQWSSQLKDLYLLCHVLKPFCYMLTNEKYRYHVLAVLQGKPFRMLPNLLRRKSRVVTVSTSNY